MILAFVGVSGKRFPADGLPVFQRVSKIADMSKRYLIIRAIILALVLIAVGVGLFYDLAKAERTGESKSINVLLAFAYNIAGKWGVMATWGVFSGFFVWLSFYWTNDKEESP